jgi:NFU1 iron-sulfur cluster scaffold homolog, mitochondrial
MSEPITNKIVDIYLEANPNPNSLKFVVDFLLIPEGDSLDFPTPESAAEAPLAQELFGYDFVTRVFYMNNFITITKREYVAWAEIQDILKQHIKTYLEAGKPLVSQNFRPQDDTAPDTEAVKKIKGILDEYIRPAVEQDGGAISFHSFENGVLKVLLQGSCSGCPSSTITLKAGIENLMKRMVPEVQTVEAQGV